MMTLSRYALAVAIIVMVGFQIAQRWWLPDGFQFNVLHVVVAATVVGFGILSNPSTLLKRVVIVLALAIVGLAMIYFYPLAAADLQYRAGFATSIDIVMGCLLLVVVFILAWESFGPIFPIIGLIAIAYAFLGPHVPEPFTGPPMSPYEVVSRFVLNSMWTGIIGQFASYVWLIVFWGMLLESAGAGKLIAFLAYRMGRKISGGPAYMATFSSGLVGSVTGAGGSDVAITGPITIPLMKRVGYSAAEAAAIEATASSAAGISPPILGIVAFVMADQLAVRYLDIVLMCMVPAVLWYTSLLAYVVATTAVQDIRPLNESDFAGQQEASYRSFIAAAVTIFGSVGVLLALVLMDEELYTAVFYAFVVLIALAAILRPERSLKVWMHGIERAAVTACAISMVIVIVGVFSDVVIWTGLGNRLGDIIYNVSGGNLLIATLFMMGFGIFLSAGLPSLAIYFVMVSTFQPIFHAFSVPVAAVHYVAFYAGVLHQLVLPVAATVIVAAGLAGANYWTTGIHSLRMSVPILLMPFVIISAPEILIGVAPTTVSHLTLLTSAVLGAGLLINFAVVGWLGVRLSTSSRLGLLIVGVGGTGSPMLGLDWVLAVVVVLTLMFIAGGWLAHKRSTRAGFVPVASSGS